MPVFVPLLLTTALTVNTPKYKDACPPLAQPPAVHVEVVVDQPVYNHASTYNELAKGKPLFNPYKNSATAYPLGVTQSAYSMRMKYSTVVLTSDQSAYACSWYRKVNLTLYLKSKISVAKEIPGNICWYRETLNHERKHFDTSYNVIQDYRPVFQDELEHQLTNVPMAGPYAPQNQEQMDAYLAKHINGIIEGIADRMQEEDMKRQLKVDTIQEYERVAGICRGEKSALPPKSE